jgi:hypothetical protein
MNGPEAGDPAVFYAEDHCALRWPIVFNGVFWGCSLSSA